MGHNKHPFCPSPTVTDSTPTPDTASRMTALERRASFSLATVYAMRMLGLFMVLPVFALEARRYPGGEDAAAMGLALGVYGLVQAVLQIPFGLAADRWGRKRVMLFGLALFAVGSLIAAGASDLHTLAWGRAMQGCGAISAAVSALLADQTRDVVRTKALALLGGSIGLMFALSLVVGPWLSQWAGLPGLFNLTAVMAVAGMAMVVWWTPPEPPMPEGGVPRVRWSQLFTPDLLRLYVGVFVLYAVQFATWVSMPALLVQAGVLQADHGWVYLPTVLLSFVFMGMTLFPMERRGQLRPLFLACIAGVMLVQLALLWVSLGTAQLWMLAVLLFFFFCGFNVLEASQPSLASRFAPRGGRGSALGVYNTLQSLGIFAGGAFGGWLAKGGGTPGLFLCCALLMGVWLAVAWAMVVPPPHASPAATPDPAQAA